MPPKVPNPADSSEADQPIICIGEFRLDLNLRSLYRGTDRVSLTPKPLSTLEYLVRNRHRVVPKSELLEVVWGGQRETSTVEHAIGQVRRALGDDAEEARYIETVPGQGYRLIADVYPIVTSGPEAAGPSAADGATPADRRDGSTGANEPLRRSARRFSLAAVGAAVAVMACLGASARLRNFLKPAHVARASLNGTTLVAFSASGDVLWRYEFGAQLRDTVPRETAWRSQVVDVNRDGVPEVFVAAYFADAPGAIHREELFCFSSDGKLLWRYRPEINHGFNGPELNGPWTFHYMLVVPEDGPTSIWLSVGHWLWWPSFIIRLSVSGAPKIVFVNSGQVYALLNVQTRSGHYILAGGVNNEYQQASLAMLAEAGAPAISPQSEEKYRCARGCPLGRPYRYILFPRSELSAASDEPYNKIGSVFIRPGGVTVEVDEIGEGDRTYYGFSQQLQPEWATSSDNWGLHRQFEREGRIKHSLENCPERNKPAILRICDENGNWSALLVPRSARPH